MRKIADCRSMPSESGCSLTISGEEEEVVRAAAEHAASVHGHVDGPELREGLRAALVDEDPSRV
jgi:predicted small metal-binding protein